MQNDTISRSALVAELEAFKMSMGDPVIRFIVDRVIELVKAQSGVEVAHVTPCEDCMFYTKPEDGDFLGVCKAEAVAVSNGGEIYPERDYFCPYGRRQP